MGEAKFTLLSGDLGAKQRDGIGGESETRQVRDGIRTARAGGSGCFQREGVSHAVGVNLERVGPAAVEGGVGEALAQAMSAGSGHADRSRGMGDIAGFEQRGEEEVLPGWGPAAVAGLRRQVRRGGRGGEGLFHPTG